MKNWMKSSFFWTKKNLKVKYIETYSQEKDIKLTLFFFQIMSEIDLNISLQWWIISYSIDR